MLFPQTGAIEEEELEEDELMLLEEEVEELVLLDEDIKDDELLEELCSGGQQQPIVSLCANMSFFRFSVGSTILAMNFKNRVNIERPCKDCTIPPFAQLHSECCAVHSSCVSCSQPTPHKICEDTLELLIKEEELEEELCSSIQSAEQPSPLIRLPSSHSSLRVGCMIPSPQVGGVQFAVLK
jgi:hypothetical protein